MKKSSVSPNQLVLVIVGLINVVIIRDGSLLDGRLYLSLMVTIPLLFYLIFTRRKRIM